MKKQSNSTDIVTVIMIVYPANNAMLSMSFISRQINFRQIMASKQEMDDEAAKQGVGILI